jgi:glycosyltransferase involved in cell wall biosynthesis
VSVVVPLYRYRDLVDEALDSVVASKGIVAEIIVIEDHSGDGTRERLEEYLDQHAQVPILALCGHANRGLAAARNLGFRRARTDMCFLLDADNAVRETALRTLADELKSTDAAFAYSMIEVFGDETSLLSQVPFSLDSLVRGNYIDAMSLVRRSTWERVGGFVENAPELYGWEDYAFWLAVAQAGLTGHFVPKPLCRYRRHGSSMVSITNLDPKGPERYLRRRFPDLPWP